MKEIFLILYFNSNDKSLIYLRDLIKNIESISKKFIICSHSSIPQDIIDKSEGYVFDKNNYIFQYIPTTYYFVAFDNGNTIFSPYFDWGVNSGSDYSLAAFKNLVNGIHLCYNLGYNLIHCIEYDSNFNEYEFLENEKLIKDREFSAIFYGEDLGDLKGEYGCFFMNKINPEYFYWDEEKWLSIHKQNNYKGEVTGPNFIKSLLPDQNILYKPSEKYIGQKNLTKLQLPWFCMFQSGNNVNLFIHNPIDEPITDIYFYTNLSSLHIENLGGENWRIIELCKSDELKFLHVYYKNKFIIKWNINSDEDYKNYVLKNFISDEFNPPKID